MKNWKTTLGGVLIALGSLTSQIQEISWLPMASSLLIATGGLVAGVSATDNKTKKITTSRPKKVTLKK